MFSYLFVYVQTGYRKNKNKINLKIIFGYVHDKLQCIN